MAVQSQNTLNQHVETTYLMKIVRAIIMVPIIPDHPISLCVASRPQKVMDTWRGILDQRQDWLPPSTIQPIALRKGHLCQDSPRMNHGQEVVVILRVESPEINSLAAMGVDHGDILALLDREGNTFARWNDTHLDDDDSKM